MMTMHPANNVKAIPATNLLASSIEPEKTTTVVEYSSGSTVLSMSLIARAVHGVSDVHAFLSNKTSLPKIRLMRLFGIDITLFGGPSQPEPCDRWGGIFAAKSMAQHDASVVNPDQYGNSANWRAHLKWTAPHIHRQLPEINLICAGMGTSGTMTGLGQYFKTAKPSVFRLGVCTAAGERVPGPRSYALLTPVEFPWRDAVDQVEEVGAHDAYSLSLELTRQGLVCGPSSGFNLQGLRQLIDKRVAEGSLQDLAGPHGEIHCVFMCCDLPYQYVDEYFEKLDAMHFPTIHNEHLLDVDLYRYDEKWERDATEALIDFYEISPSSQEDAKPAPAGSPEPRHLLQPKAGTTIIDLRQASDFALFSLPGSVSMPFVKPDPLIGPFKDSQLLRDLWQRLDKTFAEPDAELEARIRGKRVLLLCYDGDSSRVAASVLRAKGVEADCIRGGLQPKARLVEQTDEALDEENGEKPAQQVPTAPSSVTLPLRAM